LSELRGESGDVMPELLSLVHESTLPGALA
jgi:hypothetical protein